MRGILVFARDSSSSIKQDNACSFEALKLTYWCLPSPSIGRRSFLSCISCFVHTLCEEEVLLIQFLSDAPAFVVFHTHWNTSWPGGLPHSPQTARANTKSFETRVVDWLSHELTGAGVHQQKLCPSQVPREALVSSS